MRNIQLIAVREFLERVRNRGFLISSIAVPVLMIVIWAATGIFNLGSDIGPDEAIPEVPQNTIIGYVDEAGLIDSIPSPFGEGFVQAYATTELANQALEAGEIDAYYWIPPDYLSTGEIKRVSIDLPNGPVETGLFTYIMMNNLVSDSSSQQPVERLQSPLGASGVQFVSEAGEVSASSEGLNLTPFILTFVIIMPLFISGGYLLQSLAQEKGSRVMEILLVSLRPTQLLAGKLLGLGALTLVQYLFWGLVIIIALLVTGQDLTQLAAGLNIASEEILFFVLFALGGYTLYAAFMAGIGALAPNLEGGRSWVLLISIPMTVPIYFWMVIVEYPNGILSTILSLFPFTAPVSMLMRMTSATVPLWQVGISLALLFITAFGVIWLMARLFRVRTLLSGEEASLKRFWETVTE